MKNIKHLILILLVIICLGLCDIPEDTPVLRTSGLPAGYYAVTSCAGSIWQ